MRSWDSEEGMSEAEAARELGPVCLACRLSLCVIVYVCGHWRVLLVLFVAGALSLNLSLRLIRERQSDSQKLPINRPL